MTDIQGERIRVLFLIRQLETGGAQRQLRTLVRALDPGRFEVTVAPMYGGGGMWGAFEELPHIKLVSLDKQGRWDVWGFGARLLRVLREQRPQVIHGYMGGANELALLAAWLSGARAIWGLRVSDQDWSRYTTFRRLVFRLGAWASRYPALIIANSWNGREAHIKVSYCADRMIVIPNGIDTDMFQPLPEAGRSWRQEHGFRDDEFIISLPARLDPMKDHSTFLLAAQHFVRSHAGRSTRFVCAGDGSPSYAEEMRRLATKLGLEAVVTWLPPQRDVLRLYNGSDIVTLTSSFGEGFPNVVAEAMASGAIVVATSAGDAALAIGDAGFVCPPGEPKPLADAWSEIESWTPDDRRRMAERARARIMAEFNVSRLVERTQAALRAVAAGDDPMKAAGTMNGAGYRSA